MSRIKSRSGFDRQRPNVLADDHGPSTEQCCTISSAPKDYLVEIAEATQSVVQSQA